MVLQKKRTSSIVTVFIGFSVFNKKISTYKNRSLKVSISKFLFLFILSFVSGYFLWLTSLKQIVMVG